MPVADELAALRALGTVKATSTALSSTQSTDYVFTTPQQQELIRKQKVKQEKAAREAAEKYLRKHNAGGINDLWYKKLRELKARKKAGGNVAWKKKERTTEDGEEEVQDDEDVGLEVGMLPDHLVKALKAKYETENAEEALSKALKDEEEGKGTILSEVMADMDVEENATDAKDEVVDGDEKKLEDDAVVVDEEVPADSVDGQANDKINEAATAADNTDEVNIDEETTAEKEPEVVTSDEPDTETQTTTGEENIEHSAPSDVIAEAESDEKEEPVEEVRSKIEHLSIEDTQSKEETDEIVKEGDAKTDENSPTLDDAEKPSTAETPEMRDDQQLHKTNLFYNTKSKYLFTGTDAASEEIVDLLDASQRAKLNEEQNTEVKEQLIALQDQIGNLLASWRA